MNSLQIASAVVFWICILCVFYTYIGYPILVWVLARWFGRRTGPPGSADESLPAVSLLIAAYNEEEVIEKRLQSALAMDYPRDKLEIAVASDGSSDQTADLVRRYQDRGVRLFQYQQRRGKASVLNASVPKLKGDIVLLSDANTQIDPDALKKMVRWHRDPRVGVVCGRLILTDAQTGRNVDGLYWKYETFLKRCDGRLGGLLGANGAIYTIRKDLFHPIPTHTILDDFVIPLQAKLYTGCKLVYEYEAVAREETSPGIASEFHRRARIGAGGFQSIRMLWRLLNPRYGWVTFTFCSHKVARWVCPFFLAGLMLSNLLLVDQPFYQMFLLGQLGFYALAALMAFLPARSKPMKLLRLTTMFTSMNLALVVGFFRWIKKSQKATWKRTDRVMNINGVQKADMVATH